MRIPMAIMNSNTNDKDNSTNQHDEKKKEYGPTKKHRKHQHKHHNNQRNIYISSYDPKLSYYHGTKCIGTFIHIKGKPFFFMEDILLFQSHDVSKRSWYNKYILFFEIMNMYRPLKTSPGTEIIVKLYTSCKC